MFMEYTLPPSSHSSGCVCPTRGGCWKGGSSCRRRGPCNLVQTVCLSVRLSVCLSCPAHGEQVPPAVPAAPLPPSPLPRPPRSTRTNSERQLRQTRVTAAMSLARTVHQMRARTDKSDRTLLRSVVGPQPTANGQWNGRWNPQGTNADLASSPDSRGSR